MELVPDLTPRANIFTATVAGSKIQDRQDGSAGARSVREVEVELWSCHGAIHILFRHESASAA